MFVGMKRDIFNRQWILEKGIPIIEEYGGNLTLRALHYRLVAAGMTNSQRHYKRVVSAMINARWNRDISFDSFVDHERDVLGVTKYEETSVDQSIDDGCKVIDHVMNNYSKNRWENQVVYPEVFIEKKALQGVFERPCHEMDVSLSPCKGYPSITYLHDAALRFQEAINRSKEPVILYFGDYNPNGEDIPRSIEENIGKMGVRVEVRRIALMEHQVLKWNLPPAPAKTTDSRSATWDGLGQVELDAVRPEMIEELCREAIESVFDYDLYDQLMREEEYEREHYRTDLRDRVNRMFD